MDWLQALILGIIQGLTEFLPVSSSGHLIIGKKLLGLEITDNIAFEIVVHCATVLSTITILRKEIGALLMKLFKFQWNPETQYIAMILLSMIPVMIVGLFFKDMVENLFGEGVALVGGMLLVTAVLLALTSFKSSKFKVQSSKFHPLNPPPAGKIGNSQFSILNSQFSSISWGKAFLIGLAQAVAVLPGLSRSGTTIATGLLAGVKKEDVAKFSFLMVLIPILGETLLSAMHGDFSTAVSGIPASSLIVGFLAAYLCGCFACKFMIELVKRTNLLWFALYCSIVGITALIYSLC
jgi:undecaprenyl-diphosphatase